MTYALYSDDWHGDQTLTGTSSLGKEHGPDPNGRLT